MYILVTNEMKWSTQWQVEWELEADWSGWWVVIVMLKDLKITNFRLQGSVKVKNQKYAKCFKSGIKM